MNATAAEFNSLSNRAFAERILNNISITSTSLTGTPNYGSPLQAYNALLGGFADYLSLVGVGNRGVVAAQLAKIISNLEIDTQFGVYGPAAVSLNRQITVNSAYSADPKNIVDGVVPTDTGTVIANFDTIIATNVPDTNGGTGTITATPPAGGSGSAYALLRSGGQVYALGLLNVTVPFTATRKTLSARVYSPTAGIPIVLKVEKLGTNGSITTGDTQANETVVVGWQTLTWTFNSVNPANTYDLLVLLPRLGTVDAPPGKTYYFDDIKLLAAGGSTPVLEMGAAGPQTLTIAAGDVKTRDGGNTMFVAGEGIFALNYVGSAETQAPFNLAAWPDAKSANFTGVTGVAGGSIGYFQDDVNLSASPQKIDEGGWVAGTAISPDGVPNFFRYFVLKGAVSTNAYMGLYANAPNNGTVNTSSFSKIKLKVWGPGPMFDRTNFTPILEITLTGPKVAGCTTGSGGTEITQNLTANLRNGAGGAYTLPFAGFTVKGLCGTDTAANAVANVRANLARVVVTVPGTSFNYTNLEGGNYATGINLGPIGFTNN